MNGMDSRNYGCYGQSFPERCAGLDYQHRIARALRTQLKRHQLIQDGCSTELPFCLL